MTADPKQHRWGADLVPFLGAVALAVVGIVFRGPIIDWFTGNDRAVEAGRAASEPSAGHTHGAQPGAGQAGSTGDGPAAASARHEFHEVARAEFDKALASYDRARARLAEDSLESVSVLAVEIAQALRATRTNAVDLPPHLDKALAAGAVAADQLAGATALSDARAAFGSLSEQLSALAAADPSVAAKLFFFECSMTSGYNKWLQFESAIANPYQGSSMLTCGSEVELQAADVAVGETPGHDPADIHHYTCPMDTWVKSDRMGKCPVCGMDLLPVTTEEYRTGVMRIDHRRRQLIGLRTGLVEQRAMTMKIRAIGKVTFDERLVSEVSLKYDGFIERLYVNQLGQKVAQGQTLFTLYSPQLYTAQQEYVLALDQLDKAVDEAGKRRAQGLLDGASARLRLLDVSAAQLRKLAASREPQQYLPIAAPSSGYVVDKAVVEGAAVKAGERLYRVAGLKQIWVEADVYEQDIPFVKVGQTAKVSLSHLPGKTFEGKISFLYPYLDAGTRTARARIELTNADLELKPDMFATVEFSVDLGQRLAVPESAVIYSGPRRIVFLDIGNDQLRPQLIEVGVKAEGYFEVLSGAKSGDIVITSGNFLLSAETRLKSATGLW